MPRGRKAKRKFAEAPLAENAQELAHGAAAEKETEAAGRYHFFWQSGSPFSQWHISRYVLNGVEFSCAEQGMMHGKALLFGDTEVAEQILEAKSPRKMKALGRKVRFFDHKVWNKERMRIVYENSVAKFTQNPHLLEALLNTTGQLVEASPSDKIWGIGLVEANARNTPEKFWPGLNLLGQILTRVRDEIRAGDHNDALVENEGP
ncbi:Domain of unknown function (DUF1768) [Seminavis robusta]|uniref:NADAR domain-containing protein n=1 Tax=Seminavis robusta TaxID=568900 RepID=A0A9N8HJI0_9STRA|nr:Domain of unknown function (DUF1768) [Seminavis robusta]|eukprot:Sro663_g183550.1 Domain of unknown function (DUF1768) (205) ;mRNA; r:38825-39439